MLLFYGCLVGFGSWCIFSFRKDFAQLDLSLLSGGWWAVAAACMLSLFNYALRIVRWQFYLRHLGHRLPWGIGVLSYMAGFAFTLSPGKVGEMVRARYYQPYKIPLSDVTAAFFAERLMDLIVIMLLSLVLLTALPSYRFVMWAGLGLIFSIVTVLIFMPWSKLQAWAASHAEVGKFYIRAANTVASMLLQARGFLSPLMLIWALALGLVAWGAEAVGFKIVGDVLHPLHTLSWAGAIGIYATATLVGALSFVPGGLGSTEAVMASLLYTQGFGVPQAFLLTLICRVLTLWLAVVIGWFCIFLLRYANANESPVTAKI